eukprot:3306637-Alexandrium_andersonii.AAC.1
MCIRDRPPAVGRQACSCHCLAVHRGAPHRCIAGYAGRQAGPAASADAGSAHCPAGRPAAAAGTGPACHPAGRPSAAAAVRS